MEIFLELSDRNQSWSSRIYIRRRKPVQIFGEKNGASISGTSVSGLHKQPSHQTLRRTCLVLPSREQRCLGHLEGWGGAGTGSPEWLKGTARPLLRSLEVEMRLPMIQNKSVLLWVSSSMNENVQTRTSLLIQNSVCYSHYQEESYLVIWDSSDLPWGLSLHQCLKDWTLIKGTSR